MLYLLWDSAEFTREKREWLEKQFAEIPKDDWLFVMLHCDAYASGTSADEYSDGGGFARDNNDIIRDVMPLLEKMNVDAVITGYNHHLEALTKNGLNYFVVGGMGGITDGKLTHISTASLWHSN